ncbi:hypothetical protein [Phyllobacterium sp. OV277]|uniref:hypothetical protein n=1 Tax=Phyllobacterium sp. OV277 TaxID=1882772 RepID=UPI0008899534|nr:hypothetical protein [Phyllobacterium sp. OV277]SDO78285.1 hypothetical protein SAMN05443582_1021052 [Phyllobacterium sp. OV277]
MSVFDTIKKLFGGTRNTETRSNLDQPGIVDSSITSDAPDVALEQSWNRRDAYWAALGNVENDVLGHMISPSLRGGPFWPTMRQAYRVIRCDNTIIIATDGMSDPFEGISGSGNGFEMELFIETPDVLPQHVGEPGDISELSKDWAFALISHVAGIVADAGGITGQLEVYGVLSMELPGVSQSHALSTQLPDGYVTDDDCLGILLGVPVLVFPNRIDDMPLSSVTVVPITLIMASELQQLRSGGAEARKALVGELLKSGRNHFSSFQS